MDIRVRVVSAIAALLAIAACVVQTEQLEGQLGPAGEQGPPGEEGPEGMIDGAEYMSAVSDTGTSGSITVGGHLAVLNTDAAGTNNGMSGSLGVGTLDPAATLHVSGSDGATTLLVEETNGTTASRSLLELRNEGSVRVRLENGSVSTWTLGHAGDGTSFTIRDATNAINAVEIDSSGNVTLAGDFIVSGVCSDGDGGGGGADGCDAVFDPGYPIDPIAVHAAKMWKHRHLPGVGSTSETGPMRVGRKTAGILNELEKAHIYIERLHKRLKAKERKVAALETRMAVIEKRLGL